MLPHQHQVGITSACTLIDLVAPASLWCVNRVFILGAGFSKAIHKDMPVLGDLGRGVKFSLQRKKIPIGSDLDAIENVEQWLTLLVDPAPWLTASNQQRNAALFIDVSQAIYEVIHAMQSKASVVPPPDWLFLLVNYWHRMKSTVITFNYDCLVELAYCDAVPPDPSSGGKRYGSDLIGIAVTPVDMRTRSMIGSVKHESFRLLKLHGSLGWWYSGPQAEPSDPIYSAFWVGDFRRGIVGGLGDQDDTELLDKVPMLIPPAATKGPFYKNRLLAAQWVQAAKALNDAEELVLMGYSAPLTDLAVTTLIATQFKGTAIVPVDLDASVVGRVRKLSSKTSPPDVVGSFIDADAIAKWVTTFAADPGY
jgi:hypothetical protein